MLWKIWRIPSSPAESPTERMFLHNNNKDNKATNRPCEITDWCFQKCFGGSEKRWQIRYDLTKTNKIFQLEKSPRAQVAVRTRRRPFFIYLFYYNFSNVKQTLDFLKFFCIKFYN